MKTCLPSRDWLKTLQVAAILSLMVVVHGKSEGASGYVDTTGCSWAAESKNGKYTFAGIKPKPIEEQIGWLRECDPDIDESQLRAIEKRVRQIHDRYPLSGMYEKSDPPKLLWAAHWYTFLGPDGVRGPGDWAPRGIPSDDGSRLVVTFPNEFDSALFADIYGPNQFKLRIQRESILSGYECLLRDRLGFREAWPEEDYNCEVGLSGDTLLFEFSNKEFAEISIRDGRVLRSKVFPRQFWTPLFVLAFLLLLASVILLINKSRRRWHVG